MEKTYRVNRVNQYYAVKFAMGVCKVEASKQQAMLNWIDKQGEIVTDVKLVDGVIKVTLANGDVGYVSC